MQQGMPDIRRDCDSIYARVTRIASRSYPRYRTFCGCPLDSTVLAVATEHVGILSQCAQRYIVIEERALWPVDPEQCDQERYLHEPRKVAEAGQFNDKHDSASSVLIKSPQASHGASAK